jgi:hypothetical protein
MTACGTARLGGRAAFALLAYTLAGGAVGWYVVGAFPDGLLWIPFCLAVVGALTAAVLVVPDILTGLRLARARRRRR